MIRAISWNVRGLGLDRLGDFRSALTDEKLLASPDFLLLQETHIPADRLERGSPYFSLNPHYYSFHAPAPPGDSYAGVSILVRHSPSITRFEGGDCDPGGRWATASVTHKDLGDISLVSLYAHAGDEAARQRLFASLPWRRLHPLAVIGGDWNCIIRPEDHQTYRVRDGVSVLELDPRRRAQAPDAALLSSLLAQNSFRDARDRTGHPDIRFSFSYNALTTLMTDVLLDRFYVSEDLENFLLRSVVLERSGFSDHRPVLITLAPHAARRGEGLWRLNTAIIPNSDIGGVLYPVIQHFLDSRAPRDATWHERYVGAIQRALQNEEKKRKSKLTLKLVAMRLKVDDAEQCLRDRPNNYQVVQALRAARAELRDIERERWAERAFKRAIRWLHGAERPLAGFFRSVRGRPPPSTTFDSLAGAPSGATHHLLKAAHIYYQNLFSGPEPSEADIQRLCSVVDRKLSPQQRAYFEQPLCEEELQEVVRKMKNGSAPGPDGLPAEIYKRVPALLKPLLEIWEWSHANHVELPCTLMGSAIILLHKKGPRDQLDNYHPISLRNVAIKIISAAIASRLNTVIRDLVGPNQAGFIPKCDIRNNIYEILLARNAARRENVSGAIVFLDFKKAYDKICHRYIFAVLEAMNFPPVFLQSIGLLLFWGAFSKVNINGFFTEDILLRCGVPQGDPSSPPIYSIGSEPLRAALMKAPERGLVVANTEVRVGMLADDTTTFVGSQAGFQSMEREIQCFCRAATMEINVAKSRSLLLGPAPPNTAPYAPLKPDEFERVLGARIGHGHDRTPIWPAVEAKVSAKIDRYQRYRHLSLFGRVQLANASILSHAWYFASFLPMGDMDLEKLYKKSCGFVWRALPGFKKIKYEFAKLPKTKGGIGLLDPRLQVRAIQAHRLVALFGADEDGPWRHLLWDAICHTVPRQRFDTFLATDWAGGDAPLRDTPCPLAADVLTAWSLLKPTGTPVTPRGNVSYDGRQFTCDYPAIPTGESLANIRVCGDKKLSDVSVKLIYRFLRDEHLKDMGIPRTIDLPPALDSSDEATWKRRWYWLKNTVTTPKAKQTCYLRWVDKLYLGENRDSPDPICPHCQRDDSVSHFAKECPEIQPALEYFLLCWRLWRPEIPRAEIKSWIDNETPPAMPKRNDSDAGGAAGDPKRVVLALWSILVHVLYQKRAATAKAADLGAPSLTTAIVTKWREYVTNLLEAYAQLDPENDFDRVNMDNWRAQFALPGWYIPGPIAHWDKVVIHFPEDP